MNFSFILIWGHGSASEGISTVYLFGHASDTLHHSLFSYNYISFSHSQNKGNFAESVSSKKSTLAQFNHLFN